MDSEVQKVYSSTLNSLSNILHNIKTTHPVLTTKSIQQLKISLANSIRKINASLLDRDIQKKTPVGSTKCSSC